jgi:hypothetical protein
MEAIAFPALTEGPSHTDDDILVTRAVPAQATMVVEMPTPMGDDGVPRDSCAPTGSSASLPEGQNDDIGTRTSTVGHGPTDGKHGTDTE